jgi:hypothetical protein
MSKSGLKISPVGHGNHDNIWFNIKNNLFSIKVNAFYNTGKAYITKVSIKKDIPDKKVHYNRIKSRLLNDFDFELVTSFEEAFKSGIKFEDTKSLLEQIINVVENG